MKRDLSLKQILVGTTTRSQAMWQALFLKNLSYCR